MRCMTAASSLGSTLFEKVVKLLLTIDNHARRRPHPEAQTA